MTNDDKNLDIYLEALIDPLGLIARKNSIVIPANRIPYDTLLLCIERRDYPNFLAGDDFLISRREIQAAYIMELPAYTYMLRNPELKLAEEQRQSAREKLNNVLAEGQIPSFLINGNAVQSTLKPEWWKTVKAQQIDGLSYSWHLNRQKGGHTKGIVLLDLDASRLWFAGKKMARKSTTAIRAQCYEWLFQKMQNNSKQDKAKAYYRIEAKTLFPHIGYNDFEKAWEKAREESNNPNWGNAGRRKSTHQNN